MKIHSFWLARSFFSAVLLLFFSNGSSYAQGQWSPAISISGNVSVSNRQNPQIAMDTKGNAIAVWFENWSNLWANRYTSGIGWDTPTLLETGDGDVGSPVITMGHAGDAIAVWNQSDGLQWNLWANRYSFGTGWGAATLITANAGGQQIAGDADGNAVVVWERTND